MNKLLLLAIFLGAVCCTPTCTTNASLNSDSSACLCNAGYYGTDATASCTPCPNHSTSTPGSTNTGASINVGACNACAVGYQLTAAASTSSPAAAATCQQCPANSTTSSAMTTVGYCTCYDSNATPLSSSVTTCACKTGYKGTPTTTSGGASTCTSNSVILSIFAALLSLVFLF